MSPTNFRIHVQFERGRVRATLAPTAGFGSAGPLALDPATLVGEYQRRYRIARYFHPLMTPHHLDALVLRAWYEELRLDQEAAS